MTVNTPFPQRPPTPFWDPRGRFGMGDVTSDIAAGLTDATTAYLASTCPAGTTLNTTLGVCQTIGTTATGSSSSGFMLLVLVAVVFMAGGGK
jgi:hypothetical protein